MLRVRGVKFGLRGGLLMAHVTHVSGMSGMRSWDGDMDQRRVQVKSKREDVDLC